MKEQNSNNGLVGAGILSAFAASLCCITPLLALIAGSSGLASLFTWLEPARPYFISATVMVLSFAWYQKLKQKKQKDCCSTCEKPKFIQTKTFLTIVTSIAVLLLTFPYYSHVFYSKSQTQIVIEDKNNLVQINFDINGMTCTGCEEHIKNAVADMDGVTEATANYETGQATVKFDKSKTSLEKVTNAINETGYVVTKYKLIEN